jgi:hypothetical protein
MPTREDFENSSLIQWLNDLGGRIRYGVPTAEKEAMAMRGEIPGHDPANMKTGTGMEAEQRRAAAYLFGKNYPNLGPNWQPIIDRVLRSGDDPKVLAVTQTAVEQGAMESEREAAAAREMARNAMLARYGGTALSLGSMRPQDGRMASR